MDLAKSDLTQKDAQEGEGGMETHETDKNASNVAKNRNEGQSSDDQQTAYMEALAGNVQNHNFEETLKHEILSDVGLKLSRHEPVRLTPQMAELGILEKIQEMIHKAEMDYRLTRLVNRNDPDSDFSPIEDENLRYF